MISEDKFIEYTQFASNCYGTSKAAIESIQKAGMFCVLDLDWQGVVSIRKLNLNARVIFIKPPSIDALRERLSGRGTESSSSLNERLLAAEADLEEAEKDAHHCDLVLINDDITEACNSVESFILNFVNQS